MKLYSQTKSKILNENVDKQSQNTPSLSKHLTGQLAKVKGSK